MRAARAAAAEALDPGRSQRDRHAEFMAALADHCASTLDAIATEIRHLARTEVREVQEPFAAGQKGSQRDAPQAEPRRVRARHAASRA